MIEFNQLARVSSDNWVNQPDKKLSIILLVHTPGECGPADLFVRRVQKYFDWLDLIIILEPEIYPFEFPSDWIAQLEGKGCSVIVHEVACGIPALLFDEGILVSRGEWLSFIDLSQPIPGWDYKQILNHLQKNPVSRIVIGINLNDEGLLVSLPGVKLPWLDLLYKGFQFPLQNIIFPRLIFAQTGLFDPHLALKDCFAQDFLVRICRRMAFEKFVAAEWARGIILVQFPSWLFQWIDVDRSKQLAGDQINHFSIDDLSRYRGLISDQTLWLAYLNTILPYYYQNRHVLPQGIPEFVQSYPPDQRTVQMLKLDYETLVDVGFRNFDVFAQGNRSLKLSYIQYNQLKSTDPISNDGLILLRTADKAYLDIADQVMQSGRPVGYAIDDDLLNFYQYGGGFEAFRPGHSAYDAMVHTLQEVDAVLCGGSYVEKSVNNHNLRTVLYEGSLLPQFFPKDASGRKETPFTFGYAGGGYRAAEMKMIWPAIERICQEYGDAVRFEFWGIDRDKLPNSLPQVSFRPFTISYYNYLDNLTRAGFHAMLVPHFYDPAPQRGKLPNKLYESVAAGAVGLYSDVPTYSVIQRNNLGLLVQENPEAWYRAMKTILEIPVEKYLSFKHRSWNFVREFYLTPAMLPVHESGLEALFFHGLTRDMRGEDGRPVVMFVFPAISGTGGGEIVFRRRIELAMSAGIRPLAVVPDYLINTNDWDNFVKYLAERDIPYDTADFRNFVLDPPRTDYLPLLREEESVKALLTRHKVALVHSGGFAPAIGKICDELHIPHVMAHYSVDEDYQWAEGELPFKQCDVVHSDCIRYAQKWADLLLSDWAVLRDTCPSDLFEEGFKTLYGDDPGAEDPDQSVHIGIVGTVMPRKSQLEAIKAVGILTAKGYDLTLDIFGATDGQSDYFKSCKAEINQLGLSDRVIFHGHIQDVTQIYKKIQIALTVSSVESFPTVIKESMPYGILVVSSRAGGISELVKDGINGIIAEDIQTEQIVSALERAIRLSPVESLRIRRNAFSMAVQEFHPRRGLLDLLRVYNRALRVHIGANSTSRSVVVRTPRTEQFVRQKTVLDNPENFPSSTRKIGRVTIYSFTPHENRWVGFQVYIGTHNRQHSGTLKLVVTSSDGNPLRSAIVELEKISDNDWTEFRFAPIQNSRGQVFNLKFITDVPGRISFYEGNPRPSIQERVLRRFLADAGFVIRGNKLHCRGVYENPSQRTTNQR